MKSYLIAITILATIVFSACTSGPPEAENKAKQDSILQVQEDSLLNAFMLEMSAIDSKLKDVNTRNGIFDSESEDPTSLSKETVLQRVESLNNLLDKNQEQLDNLLSKIEKNEVKNKELENMLSGMRQRIAQKEEQIDGLMGMLTDKDLKIDQILLRLDSMRIDNIELTEEVILMDEELHMVNYVVGEKDELMRQQIITKAGGLLGMGATKKLDASKLDMSKFTQVDQRELVSIPLYSKKASLITNHPEGTFKITEDDDGQAQTLEILDTRAFWSASDFLVIEVKN